MPEALHLSPLGHLLLSNDFESSIDKADTKSKKTVRAFERSSAEGLFTLAAQSINSSDPSLSFWKDFASRFLGQLCRLTSAKEATTAVEIPSDEEFAFMIINAPPMTGAEYLKPSVLATLWKDLSHWTHETIAASGLDRSQWLKKKAPQWHQVGRVCLHLAENKSDPEFPFAFMATYAPRIGQSGRVQFQPLANALKEYGGTQNRAKLIQLLEPVYEASKQIAFVSELVESGDIYHPLAWTPDEAYAFLKSIPQLEDSGLLTRLPNWWQSRKRASVSVSIGEKSKSVLGLDSMLSFKVNVALGSETLTQSEIHELLQSNEGLIRLNGQWAEVDKEKLQQALDHWKLVQTHAAEGDITFAQGMRLLAGASHTLGNETATDGNTDEIRSWSTIKAGDWLADTLAQLRDPQQHASSQQHPLLKGTLRPYQQDGFNWLRLLVQLGLGACLADDMGLGKTIQVIALLLSLKHHTAQHPTPSPPNPSLLVLPASLLANWKSEFAQFAPSLTLRFVHPSESDKAAMDALADHPERELAHTDVVLTTYGMLLRQKWIAATQWNLIVLDEAQAIKNPGTRQTRAVKALKSRSRIALTGTPIENRLTDLWSLFDFTCPGLLGTADTFKKFHNSLRKKGTGNYAPLRTLVSPYILRRLKTDKTVIADLPDKTEIKAYCNLAPKQAALYQKAVRELIASIRDAEGIQRRGLVLTSLMRFKQICNHPSQALGDNQYSPQASGKFERLRELCEEIASRQEKVLVFTQFREMTDPLSSYLANVFGKKGLVLHGGTPVSQRKKLVDAFQSEDGPPFFVLSLKAGGSGLTLTAASHVIHFDRWWNPAVENQATDRAYRIGQKKNVLVHKFVSRGTIEEKVDKLIEDKLALSDTLLEGGAETKLTELSDDELLNLVSLDITSQSASS